MRSCIETLYGACVGCFISVSSGTFSSILTVLDAVHAHTHHRIYDASPLRGGGTEDEQLRTQARRPMFAPASFREDQNPTLRKWITLWRSIVLSTLDLTYLPYYSYIRYLDLDDLGNLLGSGSTVKEYVILAEYLTLSNRW